jgi:mRNA interferase YafQ
MRTIEWTRQFKRDHRRVKATPRYKDIDVVLEFVTNLLAHDKRLPSKFLDHPLTGPWKGFRECHLHPNLLLIYYKGRPGGLRMTRLGSHRELFEE